MPQFAQARDGSIIVQITGDANSVNIQGNAHLTLTTRAVSRSRPPKKDLDLLLAESCSIPLVGRDHDQALIRRWLSTARPISVMAMTGAGGSGKTRLALEMILESVQHNWASGFATHEEVRRFLSKQNLSTWGWQHDTFIVLDYAASLGTDLRTWLSELADRTPEPTPKLRLLLLERHADTTSGWYANLLSGDSQTENVLDLFDPWEPTQIRPIAESTFRREILSSTLTKAAAIRSAPVPPLPAPSADPVFDQRLADPQWADPLMLMMAALTALETGVPTALSLSRPEVARRLAKREAARIRHFAPHNDDAAHFLVHLAACVTLCGGLNQSQALALAAEESSALGLQYPNGHGAAVRCLQDAFPTPNAIDYVRPDLIGEAFLLEAWKSTDPASTNSAVNPLPSRARQQAISVRQPLQVGTNSIFRALSISETNVLSALIRTAQDFADAQERRPLAWINRIVSDSTDYRLLNALRYAIPLDTLCLRDIAFELASKLLELGRQEPTSDRANLLLNLSNRQSALGQREQALRSIEEAVQICRQLAAARPDAFRPDLARSLNNLSVHQSDLGQREPALRSIEEAVSIYRQLAAARPDAFRPALALSLNNLSNRQSDLGRREQALRSIEEAVSIRRELAAARPDAFRPDLARSLNNLSAHQSDLGQREPDLRSIEEAVAIYRQLAARPDAFRPDLAMSLNNLSARQSDLGQREDALRSIEEAVSIRRQLAAARPDAFRPDLARSVFVLGRRHAASGDLDASLSAATEALTLLRPHFLAYPAAFVNLARACVADYQSRIEALNRQPDLDLLQPYLQYFNQIDTPRKNP